jgi:hypothetical protein
VSRCAEGDPRRATLPSYKICNSNCAMLHGVRVNVGNDEQPAGLFQLRTHLHSEAFMGNTQKLIGQTLLELSSDVRFPAKLKCPL